jgi:glycyl-tRNA synthetase beta chain
VIQLTARVNQKYFVCNGADGTLANAFVCVANIDASDGGDKIVEGNRKVLAARLSDARFFYETDLKTRLEEQLPKLEKIVFHEKLGTVADKVERVAKLARWLVEEGIVTPAPTTVIPASTTVTPAQAGGNSPDAGDGAESAATIDSRLRGNDDGEVAALAAQAERAARLAKADLVTGMVGEFPELQGLMGGYYAAAQGEDPVVANAIRDHYKPVGQGDDVPTDPVTVAVALADKLDTIGRFFAIGMKPTGSKDPFALRRAALGVIATVIASRANFPLNKVFSRIAGENQLQDHPIFHLFDFFVERLKIQQREAGVRHDIIEAVFLVEEETEINRLLARVHALQAFVQTEDGANLLAGYKRAANILKKEGWTAPAPTDTDQARDDQGVPETGEEDPLVLVEDPDFAEIVGELAEQRRAASLPYDGEPAELALIAALDRAEPLARVSIEREDFAGAMAALAGLRAPIDAFFDAVTVNDADPDKRRSRLALLGRMRDAVHAVADFSKIEG